MAFSNESVSLAFLSDKVLVLQLVKGFSKPKVKGCFSLPLTPQMGFYAEPDQQIAQAITDRMRQEGWKPGRALISIPRTAVIVQHVQIPVVSERDVKQIMQYELERHIPSNASDFYYDVLPQGETSGNLMQVLLVAVTKAALDHYAKIIELLELPLEGVDLNPLAQVNSYLSLRGIDPKTRILLVHVDDHDVDYTVFSGKKILFTRSVPRSFGSAGEEDQSGAKALVVQIEEQMSIAGNQLHVANGEPALNKIVFTGPHGFEREMAEEVFKDTGITFTFHNPLQEIQAEGANFRETAAYTAAVGLALRSTDERLLNLNLLPVDRRFTTRRQGTVLTGILLGVISALIISTLIAGYWRQQLTLATIKSTIAAMEPQVQEIMRGNQDYQRIQEQMEIFRKREYELPTSLETLLEITKILPDGSEDANKLVWLTELNIKDSEVTLHGKSESPEDLIQTLEDSNLFENVKFDSSGITKEGFVIKLNLTKQNLSKQVNGPEEGAGENAGEGGAAAEQKKEGAMENISGAMINKEPSAGDQTQQNQPPTPQPQPGQPARGTRNMSRNRLPPAAVPPEGEQPAAGREPADGQGNPEAATEEKTEAQPETEEPVDMETARKNLFDFLRNQRENPGAAKGEPPAGAKSFIDFLQQRSGQPNPDEGNQPGRHSADEEPPPPPSE